MMNQAQSQTPIQESAFRRIINVELAEFTDSSREIGEPLLAMANLVVQAFQRQLDFIVCGIASRRPDSPMEMTQLLSPLSNAINEIQVFRDRNRSVETVYNHLATIAESIGALSWVSLPQAPAVYIRELKDAGDYFGNRVLLAYKGDVKHTTWINKWHAVLNALEEYVRANFLTGFIWGTAISSVHQPSIGPTSEGHPPPPPPPPVFSDSTRAGGDATRAALFNEINEGGLNITQRLRPVRPTEAQVPRSRTVFQVPTVDPVRTGAVPRVAPVPTPLEPTPKLYLCGRKWCVEYYKDDNDLEIPVNDKSESLVVYKCTGSRIMVGQKMTSVMIDHCKGTTIIVHDIIASVEFVHCDGVDIRCMGEVQSIILSSCESVQIYLTSSSRKARITHSKCSSLNVCLLDEITNGYVELSVPEQTETTVGVNEKGKDILINRAISKS